MAVLLPQFYSFSWAHREYKESTPILERMANEMSFKLYNRAHANKLTLCAILTHFDGAQAAQAPPFQNTLQTKTTQPHGR